MTHIAVSEELATSINALAASRGCNTEELLHSMLRQYEGYEAVDECSLTPAAKARIHEGIEASLRGEVVSQEEVEAFFRDWEQELKA